MPKFFDFLYHGIYLSDLFPEFPKSLLREKKKVWNISPWINQMLSCCLNKNHFSIKVNFLWKTLANSVTTDEVMDPFKQIFKKACFHTALTKFRLPQLNKWYSLAVFTLSHYIIFYMVVILYIIICYLHFSLTHSVVNFLQLSFSFPLSGCH